MKIEPVAQWPLLTDGAAVDGVYAYRFECEGFGAQAFLVAQWRGEECVSRPYRFELLLASPRDDIAPADLRGRRATLAITGSENAPVARRQGVLTVAEQLDRDDHCAWYRVTLEPRLARLRETVGSATYLDIALPDLIRQVLRDGGLVAEASGAGATGDFRIASSSVDSTPTHANFVCQYEESNLDFLSRRLEHAGWYYAFEQGERGETVVFYAARDQQPTRAVELAYRPAGVLRAQADVASVSSFHQQSCDAPLSVVMRDFAGTRARLSLDVSQAVDGGNVGAWARYGDHFDSERDGERLAALRAELAACMAGHYTGTSGAATLCAGQPAALRDHFRDACNIRFYVTEVRHAGSQPLPLVAPRDAARASSYHNTFVAFEESRQFRPPLATPWPRMPGCVSAVIDAQGDGGIAELNEHGCYKVRFAFCAAQNAGRNSAWLRLATPYAGATHGMHFPLHKGSEVLVAFVNDDPDRPVIVGAVPNSENPGVVTQANPTQNTVHTAGGNSLVMDDQDGAQRVALSSPTATSSFVLGAAAQQGAALSSQGHVDVQAGSYHRAVAGAYEEHMYGLGKQQLTQSKKPPHQSGNSTVEQLVNSSHRAGQHLAFEATQGAGMIVQNYLGATVQNYAGLLSEFVEGINTNINSGLTFETFVGAHVELHRGIHYEKHFALKETSVPEKTVLVDGLMLLQTNRLVASGTSSNLQFNTVMSFAEEEMILEAGENISLSALDGITVTSPASVTLTSGENVIEVNDEGVQVVATEDISLGAAGDLAATAAMVAIGATAEVSLTGATVTLEATAGVEIDGLIIFLG
ncbi:type VI secretion system Vgr family protein [Paraburkholderia agricolaris]|uniref:type VI secretion system Vgr family protein n=1 Tax=Paraburkholderia agricolaris TaxID=2152888 RepID=UPI00129198B2|nr:type VI secretion system Vgr family protein [Paraburkholderia agricolaris]